jgi:hypothetical protein
MLTQQKAEMGASDASGAMLDEFATLQVGDAVFRIVEEARVYAHLSQDRFRIGTQFSEQAGDGHGRGDSNAGFGFWGSSHGEPGANT